MTYLPPPRPGLGRLPQPALGRLHLPDDRDKKFPLRAALPARPKPIPASRSWPVSWIGDQGDSSQCVGYSCHGFLRASPLRRSAKSIPPPSEIYTGAQQHDEWPGEAPQYEGSSIRGGMQYLVDSLGILQEYRWASTIDEVIQWLATKGPVVFGTNWYQDMFTPVGPLAIIDPTGPQEGGHAYLCYGYKKLPRMGGDTFPGGYLKFVNSWGRKWGAANGRFIMSYKSCEKLLAENGEAAVAIKKKVS